MTAMTFQQLMERSAEKETIAEADAAEFLESADADQRRLAWRAVAKSSLRSALCDAVELAREQRFSDGATLQIIERLAPLSDFDEPYIETLKQLGLASAARGDVDAYVRIARAYAGDPKLRAGAGAKVREKVVRDCSMKRGTIAYGDAMRDLVLAKARAPV